MQQDLAAAAFPTLDDAQMATLARCTGASLKTYATGQTLIRVGERDFKFFVVESGEIEIVDESGEAPRVLAVLGRGEFTADVAHLTGGAALATAVARRESQAHEVSAEGGREILNRFPAPGEVILPAFIARGHLLRESGPFRGARVVGSRYQLLRRFGVSEADTPVVTWGRQLLLRRPSDRELAEALTNESSYPLLHVEEGETVSARCVLIATGADYRRLGADGCEEFEGKGVYYAATLTEYLVVRDGDLSRSMSKAIVEGHNQRAQARRSATVSAGPHAR